MSNYARRTTVSVPKSRAEIESILTKYGADSFAYASQGCSAMIGFRMHNRTIRFVLPLPHRDSEGSAARWERVCRQRWRALVLAIKAKLECVASGISSFDEEFLAYLVLPNGASVAQTFLPHVVDSYATNEMPSLLEMGTGDE